MHSSICVSPWASARVRGELIARVAVIAYCPDGSGLAELAGLVRAAEGVALADAAQTLTRLRQSALRGSRSVIVARLDEGAEALPELIAHSNGLPVVALLPHAEEEGLRALRAGARAILATRPGEAKIAAAVSSVSQGLAVLPRGAIRSGEGSATLEMPEPLTPREIEILGLLAAGDSNRTIAARLSISVHTVKFHISSILAKLGVSTRTEAVALGLRLGIVLL